MHHVIIGGGIAGTTAAEELRKLDPNADITLISKEEHALYSRVLLPHYIKGKVPRERVFLKKESWYEEQSIERMRGVSVVKIDPINQFVETTDGRKVFYDRLLVATGGEIKLIPDDQYGVSYCRTLEDADHLVELLRALPPLTKGRGGEGSVRAGIYGGGFIACEYLNIFATYKIPTTIAFRGDHFWSHTICSQAGDLLNHHLVSHGVEVVSKAVLKKIDGEKRVEGFETTQGKHSCSILGIGIGINADFSFLKEAGVEVHRGIKSNEYLETNIQNIFTAGDVAEFFDPRFGRHILAGNWMNAMTQGRVVAKNMVGERTEFDLVSSYATNALGLEIIFIGDTSRQDAERTKLFGSVAEGGVSEIFVRGNKIVGAILIGRNADRPILTKLIQEKASPEQFC